MKAADLPIRDTGLVGSLSETRVDVVILADLPYRLLPLKAADLPIRDTGLIGSVSETRHDVIILADLPYVGCGSAHQRHGTRRISIRNMS